ncbi:MAG: FHA domain-containing protein, partial [Gemmataceae bacterium]|nr:FHA domain-containing protein [Gemmataceae bacterium]
MSWKRDSHPDLWPSLVPVHGGPDKKPRLLDKDVIALGRARGCDVLLDAAEISAVHCLFYRSSTGWRVRDCGSRTGLRINGTSVKCAL